MKFDAVLGADLHIRETVPACRTDDYENTQWKKLSFIRNVCMENSCPFLVAGDLFDHWKSSPYLLSRCIELLPQPTIMIPGQHDLQGHNLENIARTGYNVLIQAGAIKALSDQRKAVLGLFYSVFGLSYGEDLAGIGSLESKNAKTRKILLLHTLVCRSTQPWPGAVGFDG